MAARSGEPVNTLRSDDPRNSIEVSRDSLIASPDEIPNTFWADYSQPRTSENRKVEAECEGAQIGYALIDITDDTNIPIHRREWNPRHLDQKQVRNIVMSLEKHGKCDATNPIAIRGVQSSL